MKIQYRFIENCLFLSKKKEENTILNVFLLSITTFFKIILNLSLFLTHSSYCTPMMGSTQMLGSVEFMSSGHTTYIFGARCMPGPIRHHLCDQRRNHVTQKHSRPVPKKSIHFYRLNKRCYVATNFLMVEILSSHLPAHHMTSK